VTLLDQALVRALPAVPRPVVQRLASRYIAGARLDDAVRVVRRLNAGGRMATIDVLGEEIRNPFEAAAIARGYHAVLDRIEAERLDANVSVKLTALGLELGDGLCRTNLEAVLRDARDRGRFVRMDMEDATTTDATLQLYRDLREAGYDNVGVVLQARLHRTVADVPGLANVRLCKGIYLESAEIAFQDADDIRASFLRTLDALLAQGSYVAVATHDEELIRESLARIRARGLGREEYELQMLLGVRPERADALVRDGHRVRVYVPFGTHWYEYSLRRLKENPKIAGYVAGDTLRLLANPLRAVRR
jgi:proline dehydrogenase